MRSSTTNVCVLDNIPVNIQVSEVLKRLRLRSENKQVEAVVREVIELITPIARPKAIYKYAHIDTRNKNMLEIDGVGFVSHALRVFDGMQPVFPYVVTCGREIDEMELPSATTMKTYCLTVIKDMCKIAASSYLQDYLVKNYTLQQVSSVEPGHPQSWPLAQLKGLFSLLGNVENLIGVRLTDKFIMLPANSISGIFYQTATVIDRCSVCSSKTCQDRTSPYAPALLE
ncbi:MAG: hypothetical protein HY528_00115 [Chloroflexi bacterium]|nr:hypothetical protein [Chloroflexota bacterium]